jgi:hypothetical protein
MTEEKAENPTDLTDTIIETLQNPKRVQSEVGSVENQSVQDVIAADKYLKQQAAAKSGRPPIRFAKLVPHYD